MNLGLVPCDNLLAAYGLHVGAAALAAKRARLAVHFGVRVL